MSIRDDASREAVKCKRYCDSKIYLANYYKVGVSQAMADEG